MKDAKIHGPQGELASIESGSGAGLPVVFLHADSGRASQWEDMVLRLGKGRRAVAFDSRGSGHSAPARDGDYGYRGRAEDLAAVVEAHGFRRFLIVAHSASAGAALNYAANHAEAVAGILLVDPPTDPRAIPAEVRNKFLADLAAPQGLAAQQAYYGTISGERAAVRDRVVADCQETTPEARLGVAAAFAEWNPEPALRAWHGPTLILASASNDNEHALYRLAKEIPHEVIRGAGHWLQLDDPKRVEEAILSFIGRVGDGTN